MASFYVLDREPRAWSEDGIERLMDLAASAMTKIALRTTLRESGRTLVMGGPGLLCSSG